MGFVEFVFFPERRHWLTRDVVDCSKSILTGKQIYEQVAFDALPMGA